MLLYWRIQYLDSRDAQFKDRNLWLKTDLLDPATKAAVEATQEIQGYARGSERDMLRYRHLFAEKNLSDDELQSLCVQSGGFSSVMFSLDYIEDENGEELSRKRIGQILTGSPDAEMLPFGAARYDIDYMQADKQPISLSDMSLTEDELMVLGYFTRDLREMEQSAFFREGCGSISGGLNGPEFQSAVTDEEIRSFAIIFRRLYMQKEPANFLKAVDVFTRLVEDHPIAAWVKSIAEEYKSDLEDKPMLVPFVGGEAWPFSRKRLIDVLMYTQYAHQPGDRRLRHYEECLAAAHGQKSLLAWLSLSSLRHCSISIWNAGRIMADFYDGYCQCHEMTPNLLDSIHRENPGIGTQEKKEEQKQRVLREKAEELALAIDMETKR